MAIAMSEDLESQNKELAALTSSSQQSQSLLSRAQRRLEKFMQDNKTKISIIVVLMIAICSLVTVFIIVDFL